MGDMAELMIDSRTSLGATGAGPLLEAEPSALVGRAVPVGAPDLPEFRQADADEPAVVRALMAVGAWG